MANDAVSHADRIMPAEMRTRITEFFIARGFTKVWLGLVSDGAEYVFTVPPSELAQIDDVTALTLDLMRITGRKIWIIGYGVTGPSENFLDESSALELRAAKRLFRATALAELGVTSAAPIVEAAGEALVSGLDSPSLRDLAGRSNKTTLIDIREVLDATYEELDIAYPDTTSSEVLLLALEHYCLEYMDERMSPRELLRWAHENLGHEGPEIAQPLVNLDDELDDGDVDPSDLEWETLERVRAFLAERPA